MPANGQGKNRSKAAAGLRRKPTRRLLFLSAGEISLADHVASTGRRTMVGQEVRLVSFQAEAGAGLGPFPEHFGRVFRSVPESSRNRHLLDLVRDDRMPGQDRSA